MPNDIIKIAIADDHKIFRDGIKMALSGKENLKMLWEAEDGKDMMHKIAIKKPEVLLMDIRMPEIDGINAIQLIRKEYEDFQGAYNFASNLWVDSVIEPAETREVMALMLDITSRRPKIETHFGVFRM